MHRRGRLVVGPQCAEGRESGQMSVPRNDVGVCVRRKALKSGKNYLWAYYFQTALE